MIFNPNVAVQCGLDGLCQVVFDFMLGHAQSDGQAGAIADDLLDIDLRDLLPLDLADLVRRQAGPVFAHSIEGDAAGLFPEGVDLLPGDVAVGLVIGDVANVFHGVFENIANGRLSIGECSYLPTGLR